MISAHADWLDVTYSPDDNPCDELSHFLRNLGFSCLETGPRKHQWSPPLPVVGKLIVSSMSRFSRVSASGQVLSHLRNLSQYDNYLALLSSSPYKVSRLDAAYDVPLDASPVIARFLRNNPREFALSRQRPLLVKSFLGIRLDGKLSGTVYLGHRTKSRVTAKIYDKSLEQFERLGLVIPPTTRYELTFRDGLASLRDAHNPTAIFWAHTGSLLDRPSGLPEWSLSSDLGWSYHRPPLLPMNHLKRLVSISNDLDMMLMTADTLGPSGRNALAHLILQKLELIHKGDFYPSLSNSLGK